MNEQYIKLFKKKKKKDQEWNSDNAIAPSPLGGHRNAILRVPHALLQLNRQFFQLGLSYSIILFCGEKNNKCFI